jgi:hypothetical protein
MSVSSRSMGSEVEASERGDADNGGANAGAGGDAATTDGDHDDEDDDTLDITHPLQQTRRGANGSLHNGSAAPSASSQLSAERAAASSAAAASPSAPPPADLRAFKPVLHQLAELRGIEYSEVTLEARQILVVQQLPSQRQRRAVVEELLLAMGPAAAARAAAAAAASAGSPHLAQQSADAALSTREDSMSRLIDDDQPLLDDLMSYFAHPDPVLRRNAAEVYVRRLYRLYSVRTLKVADSDARGYLSVHWTFKGGDGGDGRIRAVTPADLAAELAAATASPPPPTVPLPLPLLRMGGARAGSGFGVVHADSYVDLSSMALQMPAPGSPVASARTDDGGEVSPRAGAGAAPNAATSAYASAAAAFSAALRQGTVAAFPSFESFRANFGALLADFAGQLPERAQLVATELAAVAAGGAAAAAAPSREAEEAALAHSAINVPQARASCPPPRRLSTEEPRTRPRRKIWR